MFHTDSGTRVIRGYAYDDETGSLGAGEAFYKHPDDGAVPDGITVDADGGLWVALWDGARIIHLDTSGRVDDEVPVDADDPRAWRSAEMTWACCSSPRPRAVCRIRATETAGCTRSGHTGRALLRTRSQPLQ